MNEIKGFFANNRWLSNFYSSPLVYEGIEYPTVEHAYQAAKTSERLLKERIAKMETPAQAKKAGKTLYRVGWHDVSLQIMEHLVLLKFTMNSDLRYMLLRTGDAYLEETNSWHDTFWGVCEGVGENHLGKILMKVREKIRKEEGV